MKTDDLRESFLRFFEERGCTRVASDSLVPAGDPTLLFTPAGMNQFKDQFLGIGEMPFRRATTCQKCLRTGDIMNVGVTPRHLTFFEMLGNFSFGDYFKREAIAWAWAYLTEVLGFEADRLRVSVHETDDEAFGIWTGEVGLAPERVTRLGDHDNFWPADAPTQGPNGPCGPCSEIFYDRGEAFGPDLGITGDNDRWIEIWNLVFTQFDRQPDGTMAPLPQRNIDTGLGLERLAAVLQDKPNNMEIDVFAPLLARTEALAGRAYGADPAGDVLIRRIADHARAVSFCIADGVLPGNVHRGYVLKRLLRRAVLDGRTLGIDKPFLHELVPVVAETMGAPYPEIPARAPAIADTVRMEEEKFRATLERGLTLIDTAVQRAREAKRNEIDGRTAFELYDTYGFPWELAEEVVEREGMTLDRPGFEEAMTEARAKAREGAKMKGDVFARGPLLEVKKRAKPTEFLGYETTEAAAAVVAIVTGEELTESAGPGASVTVVLDRTPFYGESGGQVGDTGVLLGTDNLVVEIADTQKADDITLHVGTVASGTLRSGATLTARVDTGRRDDIRRNHTVTHLLHHALRQVLSDRAEQRGSWVGPERMRFDFQHGQALSGEERRRIEEIVNDRILENARVRTERMSLDAARAAGAVALFGEKYGETVRVVRVGDFSTELCGGTHIDETARIGQFRIVGEESVSAGVRRIEGVTGAGAYRLGRVQGEVLDALSQELKVAPAALPERVQALLETERALRKEIDRLRQGQLASRLETIDPVPLGGVSFVALDLSPAMGKELKAAADTVRSRLGEEGVAVLAGTDGEKVGLVVTVGPGLAPKRLKAGDIVKELAPIVGGGGGGRPDLAQAGGRDASKLPDLLAAAPKVVESMLD
jgi:alanyl-tRNA synthetase